MASPLPVLPAPDDLDQCVDIAALRAQLPTLAPRFAAAAPFPHLVLPALLRPGIAEAAEHAFPPAGAPLWTHYRHVNERKQGSPRRELYPPALARVVRALQAPEFVAWLEQLTGTTGLFPDPELEGAGMHLSQRGGFLNVHTDFQRHHHHPRWRRTVNLILFLNRDWDPAWGGAIELWPADMSACAVAVPPVSNTAVVFRSDTRSFHGHPTPLDCPPDRERRSLALYYYTLLDERLDHEFSRFAPRPEDSRAKRLGMRLDNELVRLFSWLKRRGAAQDAVASRILRRLDRLRGDG